MDKSPNEPPKYNQLYFKGNTFIPPKVNTTSVYHRENKREGVEILNKLEGEYYNLYDKIYSYKCMDNNRIMPCKVDLNSRKFNDWSKSKSNEFPTIESAVEKLRLLKIKINKQKCKIMYGENSSVCR